MGTPAPARCDVLRATALSRSKLHFSPRLRLLLSLALAGSELTAHSATWPMRQGDVLNTGRADFIVPASRLNTNFFGAIRWQKPTPNSPGEGYTGGSSMVFFDGAGPGGSDLVVGGYHWPKGVQGMERHTGAFFWAGNPDGGESIGDNTPAFSPDGATVYVINDATDNHPLMAFATSNGPAAYWHDGGTNWDKLSGTSPKVAADGRIFTHQFGDRPNAGTDTGTNITLAWSAGTSVCSWIGAPALYPGSARLLVLSGGRCADFKAWDGTTGDEIWAVHAPDGTDADPTIDPANGNAYLPVGTGGIWVAGVQQDGTPLWTNLATQVFEWQNGVNNPQHAVSAGCLAWDGQTYYFQTVSSQGDGQLYAIRTLDGSVKWSCNTGGRGWEGIMSSPIVTRNGVLIVGNNDTNYYAILDAETNAVVLATLTVAAGGNARNSATLSPDGLLYLSLRANWFQGNGDGDLPTQQPANLFTAFDLTEHPQVTLPAPAALRGRPLNAAVRLNWTPIAATFSPVFSNYGIYRATSAFTNVAGMTPLATVSDLAAATFIDSTATNGVAYFYAIASVPLDGGGLTRVQSIGPYTPYDETDLQVVNISRTPRFPRYAAEYTGYETNEPSGFGPYSFSAATGLGDGQTTNTARFPTNGQPVTYTATIRNRGSNPWLGDMHAVWRWDGVVVATLTNTGPLAPDEQTTFTLVQPWDGQSHTVEISLSDPDARTNNSVLAIDTKSVGFLSYIDATYFENFRAETAQYPLAATEDFVDWLNRGMARFNRMFADAHCPKRIHFDVLEFLADNDPDPAVDRMPFAIFPFRYLATDGTLRHSGYYNPADDIDYGLLHEMGHQLGLIDIYQMDVPAELNLVSHQGYSAPDDLMRGCSPFLSPHSALAMTHWEDQAHGYFGQYLYGLPAQIRLRFIGMNGQPLSGASVKMYQYCDRPGLGKIITTQIKAQGITDIDGVWTLPNVPLNHDLVPTLPTGDELRDNPFGYVAVIGANGVLHFKVEQNGFTDYAWLDITEPNIAYYQGETNSATFTRQVALGGEVQFFPPPELSEAAAGAWACWAEGSAAGNTWVTNDTARVIAGANSIHFVTLDGGFDTYVRYPGAGLAAWDLAGVKTLNLSFYAINPNGFQSGSPWIRLKDPDGNYFEYQYYLDGGPVDILNEAIGQWQAYSIPLNASSTETNGWRLTTFGAPDLRRISCVEIHMDTWDYGFEVWIDGVSFSPTPAQPALSGALQGTALWLSWPAVPADYGLESATELPGAFTPYPGSFTETNGLRSLQIPTTDAQRYFRLRRD